QMRLVGPRATAPGQTGTARVLNPDPDWLRVTVGPRPGGPADAAAVPLGADGVTVGLRVALAPGAAALEKPPPAGFVVGGGYQGRSYHHAVPVAITPRVPAPQLLLSEDPAAPTRPLGDLRLRPVGQPQAYYLYVNNPTPKPRNVAVELQGVGVAAAGVKLT